MLFGCKVAPRLFLLAGVSCWAASVLAVFVQQVQGRQRSRFKVGGFMWRIWNLLMLFGCK